MQVIKRILCWLWRGFNTVMDYSAPLVALFVRVYVAKQFFMAGLTKIVNWNSTIFLFTHEYQVPLLSPTLAAWMGTTAELLLPVLLLLGVFGRLPAFALFIFNIVAVISYPFLFTPAGQAGFSDHFNWGIMLAFLMTSGTGCISVDAVLKKYCCKGKSCQPAD